MIQWFIDTFFGKKDEVPMKAEHRTLAWGKAVTPEFRKKVFQICDDFGWSQGQASHLMACMAFETGRTFSPSVKNPSSSATGLIQFMGATARGMGTSTYKLSRMSAVEQLDWVKKYFKPYHQRIRSLEDMYMAILWPRGVGKVTEYVLWKTGTRTYAVNRGLDKNRDGRVTKREAADKVREQLELGMTDDYRWEGVA